MMRGITILAAVTLAAGCARRPAKVQATVSARVDSSAWSAIEPIVDHRNFRGASWSILAIDVDRGDTVYARNSGALLVPASNQKIVTGAIALRTLGSGFRFTTVVATTGAIRQGTLTGDLVILGTGDPTFSERFHGDGMRALRGIADSLYRRGIRRITGRLVSGLDAFPDASLGRGWAWDDLDQSFAAGVDELLLNEGVTRLEVRGGKDAGAAAEVRSFPARTFPRVRVTAKTGGGTPSVWVVQDSLAGTNGLVVHGNIPPGAKVELQVTNRNQTLVFLEALREALMDRGISIQGGTLPRPLGGGGGGGIGGGPTAEERARPSPGPGRTLLFSVKSPPLSQILHVFEKNSVNQIGEALLKTLGRLRSGSGTYEQGIEAMRRQLIEWGASPHGFIIRDGSGLSRLNLISAETMVRVLYQVRKDTAFASFFGALPVAGIDGTLGRRLGGSPTRGNVRAKTGSLEQVRALSGYVTTADGRRLAFSVLCNNWTASAESVEIAIDEIILRLARLRRPAR